MSASKSRFFERVFRGQKICLRYFKICPTYFKICLTYFFFARRGSKSRGFSTYLRFVRIFGTRRQTDMRPKGHWSPAPAGRVFKGQKISGLLFKISGSDFKIRATNFFLAPMRGKRTENQFSLFRPETDIFPLRFCGWECVVTFVFARFVFCCPAGCDGGVLNPKRSLGN